MYVDITERVFDTVTRDVHDGRSEKKEEKKITKKKYVRKTSNPRVTLNLWV